MDEDMKERFVQNTKYAHILKKTRLDGGIN
jgi:hypothetical protein